MKRNSPIENWGWQSNPRVRGPNGFYTRRVRVWVEIFTRGFAGPGPHEVAGWVWVLEFTRGYPLGPQKSCCLFISLNIQQRKIYF
jgi:hypothetical protein